MKKDYTIGQITITNPKQYQSYAPEKAKEFYESEEYAKIINIRKKNSTGHILVVEDINF